jgi:hypothetical protein
VRALIAACRGGGALLLAAPAGLLGWERLLQSLLARPVLLLLGGVRPHGKG